MNNKEFYQKWGRSSTLKYLVNSIIVLGLDTITESPYNPDILTLDYTDDMLGGRLPGPLDIAECYRDLRQMPPGFIKNVIKKVL